MQRIQNEMNTKVIVKEPDSSKSLNTPSCIDLVITKSSSMLQKTNTPLTD